MANGRRRVPRIVEEYATELLERIGERTGRKWIQLQPKKPKARKKPARSGHRNINKQLKELEREGLI